MASSSRCCARRLGFWRLHPYCLRMRPTWEGWYLTPKWRRMSSATLGWVQTSPRKPKADGPWASSSSSCSRCWWVNLEWRPGGLQWRRAWGPWALARLSHWLTAPLLTPKAAAMRCWGQPSEELPGPQAAAFPPVGSLLGTQCCHTFQYASPSLRCLVLSSRLSSRGRRTKMTTLFRSGIDYRKCSD